MPLSAAVALAAAREMAGRGAAPAYLALADEADLAGLPPTLVVLDAAVRDPS